MFAVLVRLLYDVWKHIASLGTAKRSSQINDMYSTVVLAENVAVRIEKF